MSTSQQPTNRQHGWWFNLVFVGVGVGLTVFAVVSDEHGFGLALFAQTFTFAGLFISVLTLRTHTQAPPSEQTLAALQPSGWKDATQMVRTAPPGAFPAAVMRYVDPGLEFSNGTVQRLAGIDPSGIQVAAERPGLGAPVLVAEAWQVRSQHSRGDEVIGGDVEPRVVAWTALPADIGTVTIRPDNARMKLASLSRVATDFQVDWEAVDTLWHLHGDDEALLRAVIDIGLMGRLTELPPRWIVQIADGALLVLPTAPRNRLTAKPPVLLDVAGEVGEVIDRVREVLPQMLWHDLGTFLSGYRS